MLQTYSFIAFDSFIARDTPLTSKFGITFVYKLPGPIIIPSASFIASITSGNALQFVGFRYTLFTFVSLSYTASAIFDFSSIKYPFSSSAHIFILSFVTGITFPKILNISLLSFTAFAVLPEMSFIAAKYKSENVTPFKVPVLNL